MKPLVITVDLGKPSVRAFISILIVLTNVAVYGLALVVQVPKENMALVMGMVTMFQGGFNIVMGFWLGSSQGSAEKTKALIPPTVQV